MSIDKKITSLDTKIDLLIKLAKAHMGPFADSILTSEIAVDSSNDIEEKETELEIAQKRIIKGTNHPIFKEILKNKLRLYATLTNFDDIDNFCQEIIRMIVLLSVAPEK